LTDAVRDDLDGYDLTRAARRIQAFVVDELSNWYVRRNRDRFWATRPDEDRRSTADAFATLHEALETTSLLLAPFTPFLADWLHRALSGGGSAHLADFPSPAGRSDPALEREMEDARELAALGRAARERAGLKVRQPLRTLQVVLPGGRGLRPGVVEELRREVNVKEVEFLDEGDEIVRLRAKPDFSALGPRFGEDTPGVAEAIEGLGEEAAARLRDGGSVRVTWPGGEAAVGPDEVEILEEARGDLAVDGRGGYLAALDPSLDEALRLEGLARELVSRVQRLRRDAGLEVSDRIELAVEGDEPVERAASEHREYIAGETLALEDGRARLRVGDERGPPGGGRGADAPHPTGRVPSAGEAEHSEDVEIEGHHARIALRRAGAATG
jgi:isoleucyl-tRNA synthetase